MEALDDLSPWMVALRAIGLGIALQRFAVR
jgi:hypothetical protein